MFNLQLESRFEDALAERVGWHSVEGKALARDWRRSGDAVWLEVMS